MSAAINRIRQGTIERKTGAREERVGVLLQAERQRERVNRGRARQQRRAVAPQLPFTCTGNGFGQLLQACVARRLPFRGA